MKTTLVLDLLVLFSSTVCAELTQSSAILVSSQTRKFKEFSGVSGAGFEEIRNEASKTCVPVPYVDFRFSRKGTVYKTFADVSGPPKCLSLCSIYAPHCVAFNYDPYNHTCQLLSTPGTILPNHKAVTALFAFVNDAVCNRANFVAGYHRPEFDYETRSGIATTKGCCKICLAESPKCVAWDYSLDLKVCYLKNLIVPLQLDPVPNDVVTGFGAYCSSTTST